MNIDEFDRIHRQYREGCVFCAPAPAITLLSGDRFGVCFDISPLTPGHLIIHSREHHACAGEVPRADIAELDALRAQMSTLVRDRFGAATLYEHGRAGHCLSDGPDHRLCHHFHLHVVPGDLNVSDRLTPRFDRIQMATYTEIADLYEQYGDYLYLETDAGEQLYFVVNQKIERHLMRTLIAERMGCPERADWRDHADRGLLLDGMRRLRADASTPTASVRGAA